MHIELVTQPARLAELDLHWNRLWQRANSSVFQSHGWISAWWQSKGELDQIGLCIGLCWIEGRLVGAIPCTTRRHRAVRVLEWIAKECTDYCDALIDPALPNSAAALGEIWRKMCRSGRFDVVYLSHVRPDAIVQTLFTGGAVAGIRLRLGDRSERSLQVRTEATDGHGWFRSLNKKARNNHTRGMRILGETGAVTVRRHEPGEDIGPVVERMIALKRQWLAATGRSNRILDNDARILRALIDELERKKALQVFSIECAGTLVAGSVNIVQGTRMQAFFATYDPLLDRASPGTLIMVEYLMWAFDNGMDEVDFLCGEEEYKFKFANAQRELAVYVGARTLVGRAALTIGERLDRLLKARRTSDVPKRELVPA